GEQQRRRDPGNRPRFDEADHGSAAFRGGLCGHQPVLRMRATAGILLSSATSSARPTTHWPTLAALYWALSLMALAASAPATRSLMVTRPSARSFEPTITAAAALRRSAYFICAFIPDEPRYISARIPAWLSSLVIF